MKSKLALRKSLGIMVDLEDKRLDSRRNLKYLPGEKMFRYRLK